MQMTIGKTLLKKRKKIKRKKNLNGKNPEEEAK